MQVSVDIVPKVLIAHLKLMLIIRILIVPTWCRSPTEIKLKPRIQFAGQFRTRSVRFTMNNLYIVVLIALAGIALAATDAEPITAKSVQANGVKAYVYNPLLLGTNGTMVCTADVRKSCDIASVASVLDSVSKIF